MLFASNCARYHTESLPRKVGTRRAPVDLNMSVEVNKTVNNKTRNLQRFMRALSVAELEGNMVRNVENELARMDVEAAAASHSGLQRAVSAPEPTED